MKKFILSALILPFAFATPSQAQVNVYGETYCYVNVEQYVPGYYDVYGRYIPGYVQRNRNQVPCGSVVQQPYTYQRQRVCNPVAGAAMGAGLAEALSGGNGYRYKSNYNRGNYNYSYRNYKSTGWTLFGAGLGALIYSC